MKRLLASAAMAAALLGAGGAAHAQDITLRMSNWFPASFFPNAKIIQPWIADIEAATEGRVKVDILPKVVGSVVGQFDVARDGLADITIVIPGYTPERFPSVAFAELPLLPVDNRKLAGAFDQVFRDSIEPLGEFRGVHVLGIYPASPLHIETKGKTITSAEDLQGLKFRSSGKTLTQTLTAFGVTPILKSAAEAHEMLSSGTIDGQVTLPSAITGFNMLDLTDNTLVLPGGLGNAVTVFAINQDKWDQIPAADQDAIMEVSRKMFTETVSAVYDDEEQLAIEEMKAAGYTVTYASDELTEKLRTMVAPIEQEWIERAKAAGMADPAAVLEEYKRLAAID